MTNHLDLALFCVALSAGCALVLLVLCGRRSRGPLCWRCRGITDAPGSACQRCRAAIHRERCVRLAKQGRIILDGRTLMPVKTVSK
jgi:hypothetical protein